MGYEGKDDFPSLIFFLIFAMEQNDRNCGPTTLFRSLLHLLFSNVCNFWTSPRPLVGVENMVG